MPLRRNRLCLSLFPCPLLLLNHSQLQTRERLGKGHSFQEAFLIIVFHRYVKSKSIDCAKDSWMCDDFPYVEGKIKDDIDAWPCHGTKQMLDSGAEDEWKFYTAQTRCDFGQLMRHRGTTSWWSQLQLINFPWNCSVALSRLSCTLLFSL